MYVLKHKSAGVYLAKDRLDLENQRGQHMWLRQLRSS